MILVGRRCQICRSGSARSVAANPGVRAAGCAQASGNPAQTAAAENEDDSMRRTVTVNMTEGRPLILLAGFALPLLVGNLFQQAFNLADSMIVGRMLGADALAAVGATGSISFLFFSFFNGISGGCGIMTAKHFGARQDNMVRLFDLIPFGRSHRILRSTVRSLR